MNLLEKIKTRVGRQVLDGRMKFTERNACFCNLNDAANIGIIYNATDLASFEVIKDLSKYLSGRNINLSILGYVHSKELVDHYLYRKGFDFFYKSNLNWYFRPSSPVTDKFIQETFDILIDLSLEYYYPIQYITALSSAKFKAGRYTANDKYLDLMIDIEKEKAVMKKIREEGAPGIGNYGKDELESGVTKKTETELQLSFLINQLLHYLSIIKNN